jgi:hypothetical protein
MADTLKVQTVTSSSATEDSDTGDNQTEKTDIQSKYKTIGERLEYYNVILKNAIDDQEILTFLNAFRITQDKITIGKELLENTRIADAKNAKEYGEQYAATQNLEKKYQEASRPYMTSLGVARIAFKNDSEATKALVLRGKRSTTLSNWLRDTEVFYRNLLNSESYLAKMETFGRTREMLDAEYAEIKNVQNAYAVQKKEMGDAVNSTTVRDSKMEELDSWMADFIGIARLALQDEPDSLSKLGL